MLMKFIMCLQILLFSNKKYKLLYDMDFNMRKR